MVQDTGGGGTCVRFNSNTFYGDGEAFRALSGRYQAAASHTRGT